MILRYDTADKKRIVPSIPILKTLRSIPLGSFVWYCSVLPFVKGKTPVLSATPWITDSTTVQNIVIIADSVFYYIANPDTLVFKTLQK
jgi:hypothetical protein